MREAKRGRYPAFFLTSTLLGCAPLGDDGQRVEELEDSPEWIDAHPVIPDDDRADPVADLDPGEVRCLPDSRPGALRPLPALQSESPEPGPGSLRFRDPKTNDLLELPLQSTRFDTVVVGTVAETEIVQVFGNPLEQPIEAIYLFPLHERAAVDDYALTIGDHTIRGKIDTRERARETYEQAKREGHTAGLLEQQRPNLFTQHVANIAPGETIEVSLHVVQPLDQDDGRYTLTLPTVVGPRFVTDSVPDASKITAPPIPEGFTTCAGVEISVLIDPGLRPRSLRSQYHAITIDRHADIATIALAEGPAVANRDFVLSWEIEGGQPDAAIVAQGDGQGGGWFTMTIAPPDVVPDDEALRRELVFVVDTSGSMDGVPIATAKSAMRRALAQMRPDDAFAVLRFSESASALSDTLLPATPANIERGLEYVAAMQGEGGTHMRAGIEAALALPHDPDRVRMVLFLTDGYIGNEAEIFELVDQQIGDARLFGLGVGGSPNRYLLDGLSAAGRGAVIYAGVGEDIDPIVERFYERIATPVLTDLEIDWGGLAVSDVLPAELPDLFAGQPLTVFGRYQGEPQGSIELRAKTKTGALELPVGFDLTQARDVQGVSSVWARHEVDRLLGFPTPAYEGIDGWAEAKQAVIELALQHRLLTQFTSFVAVDEHRVVGADGTPQTIVQPLELPIGTTHSGFGAGGGGTGEGTIGLGTHGLIGRGGGGSGYGSGVGFGGRGTKVPQVQQGKASVLGSIDQDIIRRIVRAHINELRACYEKALTADPSLAGRMVLEISVGSIGQVTDAKITEDQIGHDLGKCMTKAAKKWRFPSDADPFVLTYPFEFAPE
jgi:Ca-activated chloride channel family protein